MRPDYRLGLVLVLSAMLIWSGDVGHLFANNLASIELNRCLVPVSWTSDLNGSRHPQRGHTAPSELCLAPVRQEKGASGSLRARLQLIDAEVAIRDGRWRDAIAHYGEARALLGHPAPGISLDIVNTLMGKQKDYPAALAAALEGLRESPEDHDLRVTAAMLYLYYVPPYSKYREALSVMRPELGFNHPYYYNIAAGSYLGLGDFEKGLPLAREAERQARAMRDPNLATSLYLLGVMQRCTGLPDAGRRDLAEALAISPDNKQIAEALAKDTFALCKTDSPNR